MLDDIDDLFRDIDALPDSDAVCQFCGSLIGEFGFDKFAFTSLNVPALNGGSYFFGTYPREYMGLYEAERFRLVDPVISQTAQEAMPFTWSIGPLKPEHEAQGKMFGVAKDFRISSGLSIPVHGPGVRYAALHLTTPSQADGDELGPALRLKMLVIATALNNIVETKFIPKVASAGGQLTPRERECLLWTARGKSSWDISMILGISEATANRHLTNAMRKLEVFSRPHAVVKAIMIGAIVP